jgi:hypothetical protein
MSDTFLVYRLKSPSGITDYSVAAAAMARAAADVIRPRLQSGEVVSTHLCPHATTSPVGTAGETAPVTTPEDWYNCRTDPRAHYEEYIAP